MTKENEKVLEEFDKKFKSPKTLWAEDENGKWYGKTDVRDFLLQVLESKDIACKEGMERTCFGCDYPEFDRGHREGKRKSDEEWKEKIKGIVPTENDINADASKFCEAIKQVGREECRQEVKAKIDKLLKE